MTRKTIKLAEGDVPLTDPIKPRDRTYVRNRILISLIPRFPNSSLQYGKNRIVKKAKYASLAGAVLLAGSLAFWPRYEASIPQSTSACISDFVSNFSLSTNPNEKSLLKFIEGNKDYITQSAQSSNLPPEFLASVLYHGKSKENSFNNLSDCVASLWGYDVSLGHGQIKRSAAATADRRNYSKPSDAVQMEYRQKLLTTTANIDNVAKYLRFLLEKPNRKPGIVSSEIIKDPHLMAVIATEYNLGPRKSPLTDAKPNITGYDVVGGLLRNSELYGIFRTDLVGTKTANSVEKYLTQNKPLIMNASKIGEREHEKRVGTMASYMLLGFAGVLGLFAGANYIFSHRKSH